jgi:branched-chain amino acid transport system ATP-binding protein
MKRPCESQADGVLDVAGVAYAYDGSLAVRDVSLRVAPGEIVALLGANGAGKTTTVKMIAGVLKAQKGVIRFGSHALRGMGSHEVVRRGVTLVPEGRLVFPQMTVLDNLRMGASIQSDKARIGELLDEMWATFPRLAERRNQLAGLMSGGEQQMLAIARGLMAQPHLLILDEPSLGLMPSAVQEMFALVHRLHLRGLGVLLVEQNLKQALRIAHRGYVLEKGATVLEGTGRDLLDNAFVQRAFLGH